MPRALVLFSGTKSIEKGLWATGEDWECVSVDREAKFQPTHCVDVLNLRDSGIFKSAGRLYPPIVPN